jgi:uncharacterized repeat protein (TIGR01451 family)
MAIIGRYSTIDKAIIVTTGNSLVLCGDSNEISLNTSDMMMPDGNITRNYTLAGSSANLNILDNSTILYAELVWLSTVKSTVQGAIDVRSIQDNPITFKTPKETISVTPEYKDEYTSSTGTVDRLRAANVTDIIKNSLSGTYTVVNVPTSIPPTGLSEVRAGWALTVIYRNNSFKPKRIVYALGLEAATSSTPIQASFTGFKTGKSEEALKGELITVFANGDVIGSVDTLKIGPSFANLTVVGNSVGVPNLNPGTSPNNPWNSFSSGQINIADTLNSNKGLIDISGSNGTLNHDAFTPKQVIGARNKWDITCVNISNTLTVNQTQLSGQYTTNNPQGNIELVAFASQVDSEAPDIVTTLDAYDIDGDNEFNISLNEQLVYIVKIKNSGKTSADNVILSTTLNPAIEFVPNSVTINGATQEGADITKSINIGSIEPTGVTNLSFTVKAVSLVQGGGTCDTSVKYNYSFNSGSGSPTYINYAETNTLKLVIQDGNLNIVKKVSQDTVKLGDTLIYTNEITNTGSETIFDILFQDKINSYCSFIKGTVEIDGFSYTDYNPNDGFNIPKLAPNTKTTVTFSVAVNSLSPNTVVENGSLITFSYIFNQYTVPVTKTVLSNSTNIQIQFDEIVGKRTADNYYPNVSDAVTYALALTNIGNIASKNVNVIEPPVAGTTFVDGSVYINKVNKPDYNPFTGFTIDSIDAQTTTTITYQVLVNEIQPNQIIENIAKVPFKYQISSDEPIISSEKDSNKVTTRTNYVVMNISETVDKAYCSTKDILYYSVNITNSGNIDAINTNFSSAIKEYTSFIPNTVAINGLTQQGFNPNLGFSLGTISPGNTINVSFQVRVNSVPTPNIIYNSSNLVYSYKPDPTGNAITSSITSNTVQTIVNKASFTFTKSVDKTYASIQEFLVYKCIISNTGTVTLKDVYFNDEIPSYVNFVTKSVYVNGINYSDYNPSNSFYIGNVEPNESIEILFGVQIISAPPFGYISNMGDITYSYRLNPNSPIITESKKSNEVQTKVANGDLTLTKYASLSYASIGDKINYSFDISNTGNVTVNNIFFFDAIPNGITFVSSSVLVNGISKPEFDPVKGFNIGSLNVGQVATVSFDVLVSSMPSPNTITNKSSATYSYIVNSNVAPVSKTSNSNNVTTTINKAAAELTKAVDKSYATINDIVTYTITAYNKGTVTLTDAQLADLITAGADFVIGSVIIDNKEYPSYNPTLGFNLPDILSGGSVVISFKALIKNMPQSAKIDNYGVMTYKYKINPSGSQYKDSATSNTVTTYINQVMITNIKSVDKQYAEVNDVLTYTFVIKNDGNINLNDTKFLDELETGLTFNLGSVTINGIPFTDYNPINGFTLGSIEPNKTNTIVFKATVSSLPEAGYINNKSIIYYSYKINPSDSAVLANKNSNIVTTAIKAGTLTITKNTNRDYARLTDTIEYSFIIKNTGNTTLRNLFFQDTIQAESSFNSGSVYVDEVQKQNFNPNNGFYLDNLEIGQYTKITFTATVNSLPQDGKLYNTGNVNYSYYVDPTMPLISKNKLSNKTTVNINDALVSATKSVDKTIAKLGNILNFTINIYNAGTVAAQFVEFTDLLSKNIIFNPGTVIINDQSKPAYNPNTGFSIDDLPAKSTAIVKFQATVASRPDNNIIKNFATVNYKYKINPADPYIEVNINTNTTTTYVAVGELTLNKSVDKLYASVNDTLSYTVNVKNTGSVDASNLMFKDLNPNDSTFVPKSVVIDGINQETLDPNVGFKLSDLTPNEYHNISFTVLVNSLPDSGEVNNSANTSFDFKLTQDDPIESLTANSNKVTTYINLGKLTITKLVSKLYATINDTLSYTINLKNIGNATCKGIFLQDIIQSEASFIPDSVKINGFSKIGFNPNTGFNIDDLPKGSEAIVTFDVKINALPIDYYLKNNATVIFKYNINPSNEPVIATTTSNTVTTNIKVGALSVTKETNKTYASIDDTVSYTITVVNTGNTNADYINFRDVIPYGLTFVKNSVKINGVTKPGFDPYQSFTLGTIVAGSSAIVNFDTTVTLIPSPSLITNTANIVFSYKVNPDEDYIVKQTDSNPISTQLNLGKLTLNKTVDKAYATIADELTYTIEVSNAGNVDASNVIFTDGFDSYITFVSGSVTVNGEAKPEYNPKNGFNLGTITTLGKANVTFKVKVKSLPEEYTVINYATATFSYKINPSGEDYTKSAKSNSVSTIIVVAGLSASKIANLGYATIGDILDYSINIKNTGNTTDSNVFFKDILSNGAVFKDGSVVIDNIPKQNLNPINGFNLDNLLSGHTTVVNFKALVTSLEAPPEITNYALIKAKYKVDPQGADYEINKTSNTITTKVNVGNLTNIKAVDKMYAKVSDTLTYTNKITNTGNVSLLNTVFFDNIESAVQFIPGTVIINNVNYPSLDPTKGFTLGDLEPDKIANISFDVKINELPVPPIVTNKSGTTFSYRIDPNGNLITKTTSSNTVTTNVVKGQISAAKTVNKTIATIGDMLVYKVTLTNVGNVIANAIWFQDTPSTGANFKAGSVIINDEPKPLLNPTTGFTLGDIGIGNVVTVEFTAEVTSIPSTNKITNQAVINFKFVVNPEEQPFTDTTYSNTTTTNVALGNLTVTKAVDKQYATIGEKLTYTIVVKNTGNINATNVVFLDATPKNSIFVNGSVTVNGVSKPTFNPSVGFDLDIMKPGEIITVVYQVEVI